jgi:hypothetical protein
MAEHLIVSDVSVTISITDDDATTATTNPIDTRDFFVRQQYRDFLNRDPDAPGFAFWTGEYDRRVNACSTITNANNRTRCVATARANISLSFFLSVEFPANRLYSSIVHTISHLGASARRVPLAGRTLSVVAVTYDEFIRDTQTIARDIIVNNVIDQTRLEANRQAYFRDFVLRADFIDRFPESQSASQFIDALFASANITPTAAERQAAVTAFGGGGTDGRAAALREIAQNNDQEFQREFNRAFVLLQYIGYLRRDPDIAGYNFWLNKLDGRAPRHASIRRMCRTMRKRLVESLGRRSLNRLSARVSINVASASPPHRLMINRSAPFAALSKLASNRAATVITDGCRHR